MLQGRQQTEAYLSRGALIIALLPTGAALLQAVRAPKLHVLLDYWYVLAKITDDSGSLLPGMLFSYHLDQPFVVPSLLFWADAGLFGGDNRVLTLLAFLLMAASVVLLGLLVPKSYDLTRRAALLAAFAFLLLSPHGTELWVQGTNGISWVPALFFLVLGVFLAHRGRFWPSLAAAAAGCFCFSVAFPAWFAIALVGLVRRDRPFRIALPSALGVATLVFWFLTKPGEAQSLASTDFDLGRRLLAFTEALGSMWSPGSRPVAVIAGVLVLAALVVLGVRTRDAERAGWLGIGLSAVALALMVGLGRTSTAIDVGLISRYSVISALATCAIFALAAPLVRGGVVLALALVTGLATYLTGSVVRDQVNASYGRLGVVAPALRAESPEALRALNIEPGVVPAAKALGAYPFTDGFTLGCGGHELGGRIDLAALPPAAGKIDDPAPLLRGWTSPHPDCVLVTDQGGTVVGGGMAAIARPDSEAAAHDPNAGWRAVVRPGVTSPVIVVSSAGQLYRLGGQ
ncbi:DUF2079 domain-containing protein [Amycolatopsis minnesotensis]|uniref:4-amino-4-deoxy-L-arabinose transferase-like glycosyltransferase n=1 Tax=Amycolatopsis minnesotensis TaxID=337894 RepID=A0ABN2RGF9_9PSEU